MLDAIFLEKPLSDGLTVCETIALARKMQEENPKAELIPLEIQAEHSVALGFITVEATEKISYRYESNSDIAAFVRNILEDVNNETSDGIYTFEGLTIQITRELPAFQTFNIGFSTTEREDDETQFDVQHDEGPDALLELFSDFIAENNYTVKSVNYIDEVPPEELEY